MMGYGGFGTMGGLGGFWMVFVPPEWAPLIALSVGGASILLQRRDAAAVMIP